MTLTETTRRKIVILGGGAAGMAVFSKLHDLLRYPHVTLIEPSTTCSYPPFGPLVGVGAVRPDEAERSISDALPDTSFWVRDEVATSAISYANSRLASRESKCILPSDLLCMLSSQHVVAHCFERCE